MSDLSTLYIGGKVFDGTDSLDDHGVMVEGDTITAVKPTAEFEGHAGARVDTGGGTLLPGLIDCHVHICMTASADPKADQARMSAAQNTLVALKNAQASLAGGITSIRDCGGIDYREFAVRDMIARGEFIGPTIMAAGRMICMTGGHGNQYGRVADGPDEVTKAVREQIHAGCDLVKIMATGGVMTPGVNPEDAHYSLEELKAGISEAHRFHRHTASHAQGTDGIRNAVAAGIDSIEHGIFMTEETIDRMKEAGTCLVATLAALRNILAHADDGRIPPYAVEKSRRIADTHRQSIIDYYKAGGKMAMGTDAGTPFNIHGDNALELAYMTECGVTPADALKISTVNAADLMRMSDRGRIADGAKADLLIVDGDPLADINMAAVRANHRMVVRNGVAVQGG